MSEQFNNTIAPYPKKAQKMLAELRELILSEAAELDLSVQESLKWGEPSFAVKGGSPIRIDWKERSPHQISMFVNCQTNLVDTYRMLYSQQLVCEGNRAVHIPLRKPLAISPLQHCIRLALRYHHIKHLPALGE